MSPLVSRSKKGRNIKPRLILVDGVNKLVVAKDKINIIKTLLCYNMGKSKEEAFSYVTIIPDENDGSLVISVPIPKETAWALYCNLTEWVLGTDLPKQIWKDLK